ncbi:DEAD/DEAH box helicase family protein [Lactobacillus johnsonii]|uniref:Type III restriction-modification system restriction subunit n=1 Tax=Lactobacillus johnsonii (strain FI9785) TaxID=633699 RepID=D0R2J7_LACJF|nr:DEAD/DEAH box helicase family protein [Lactobacillus johnsonii]CAX66192.1 type III restriction-modification system restriction subunit [Lactobacillus johnsonii FI9785]
MKKENLKPFPTLEKAKEEVNSFLNQLPNLYYIDENLKHTLRRYQQSALLYLNWSQKQVDANEKYNQLMFNMATGSGKTDVMAAVILYLFKEFKYTNFLFVSNTTAVVDKTKENFLNTASAKYLFSAPINIDGERIDIKSVESFPINQEPNTIYLKLSTVQSLSNELNDPQENALTFDDLEKHKIVILADEAHHFNAQTKKNQREETSWENLLDQIRRSNKLNRQLEFTATIDVDKEDVYEKYKDKIIYKYDLSKFMEEGYSKNVFRLQANNDNMQKLLNAVLLSQYRKRIAQKLEIPNFKPILLVKSNRIKTSQTVKDDFLSMIENLSTESLNEFLLTNQKLNLSSMALSLTYKYWLSQDLVKAVSEIKQDFNINTTINVNEGGTKGLLSDNVDFRNLNSLEDIDNPFRIIFAVAKLTEGWDVLNLYDIVRVSEEKESSTLKQTNSEAQLIGRGARYYPFVYKGDKSYTRRFDNSSSNEKRLLETLYYHTINDSKYIDNLNKSFDKMDLIVNQDADCQTFSAKVKSKFKQTSFYKNGSLFYNKTEEVPDSEYKNIGDYGIDNFTMVIDYNLSTTENRLRDDIFQINDSNTRYDNVVEFYNNDDYRLIKKAIARNKFYRFDNMKRYLPMLSSIKEFIKSQKWLGNLKVMARVPDQYNVDLSLMEKLSVLDITLRRIQTNIVKSYRKERGTNEFISIAVRDAVKDYSKIVPQPSNKKVVNELIQPKKMNDADWFPYDYAITDQLESSLINLISSMVDEFKRKYQNVYLIRNEETISSWKLHEFENKVTKHYEGYMPDFILVLDNGKIMYQVYVEPKGEQLLEKDAWKEELLESIRPENIDIIGENKDVKLYGVKFYTHGDGRNIVDELHNLNILD